MKFVFEYKITGTAVIEADDIESAQIDLEGTVDWVIDDLPGKKDWYISDCGEE